MTLLLASIARTTYVHAAYCYRPSSVVCRSVFLSVCLSVSDTSDPCKNGRSDRDAVWVKDSGGPREPCVRWWSTNPHRKGNSEGEGRPIVKYRDAHCAVICAKTVEPIGMPFGLWTGMGPQKHKFNRIRQVVPMCPHGGHIGATWRIRLNRPSAAMRPYVKLL